MNYELAKELRDAGFPMKPKVVWRNPIEVTVLNGDQDFELPTLEELIEACGGKFGALMVGPGLGLWTARGNGVEIHAPTPTEAVAKLWLALNKKSE